ncbi:MAG: aspartate--tRNA ligase, partial [Fidelibacterota bacterium]
MFKRTHTCGDLRKPLVGSDVALNGWVATRRDHGGVIFVDLRDRHGITQLTFNGQNSPGAFKVAKKLSMEDVVSVRGTVRARINGAINREIPTGEIEVEVHEIEVLSEAAPLPFMVSDRESATEEQRLKYRYLELRTKELQHHMIVRHKTYQAVRNYLAGEDFVEIETPFLMKSTPEGARDYLVPSRVHKGKFYALPQSPQTYKQLLMIGGFDRYFQIVKCFRDEDLRAARQPEFTQIDVEMSFVDEEDVRHAVEGLVQHVFKEVIDVTLETPFPTLSFHEALETYGTDKPDLRFDLPLVEFSRFAHRSQFDLLKSADCVKAIVIEKGDGYSRKVIDRFTELVRDYSTQEGKQALGGLAWMRYRDGVLSGGASKFFPPKLRNEIVAALGLKEDELILLAGGDRETVLEAMGVLRKEIGRREGWVPSGPGEDVHRFEPVWIVNFPLFEWDKKHGSWTFMHHPFTSPRREDLHLLG